MEKIFKDNIEISKYLKRLEQAMNNNENFYWQEDMICLINLLRQAIRKEKIKDSYASYILDIIYDYDGYYDEETKKGNVEGLKSLIDETSDFLRKLIKNDTTSVMFLSFGEKEEKHYNILHELIKQEKKKEKQNNDDFQDDFEDWLINREDSIEYQKEEE